MRKDRWLAVVTGFVFAAGGGGGAAAAEAATAPAGPHALAVTKHYSVMMGKLEVEEHRYVDGLAVLTGDGKAAFLTETPLDACTKLAIAGNRSSAFALQAQDGKPALVVIQGSEYPDGAVLTVKRSNTQTLEGSLPGLTSGGASFAFKGGVGDAGRGSIDATKFGGENAPHVFLDIDLPFASAPAPDPDADASAEAKWLHDQRAQVAEAGDPVAVVEATVEAEEGDFATTGNWMQVVYNWNEPQVVAVARDSGCATLVVRAKDSRDQPKEAVVQLRGSDAARKVVSVAAYDRTGT